MMTLDEANRIIGVWGEYLEFCQDRMRALFIAGIPRSLLPYPVETLEEALNTVAKHYHDLGDYNSSKLITDSFGQLMLYSDDDSALQGAVFKFGEPKIREAIISNLKRVQEEWIQLHSAKQ
jgi:hypothetical protein